jgi:hypothetical protein
VHPALFQPLAAQRTRAAVQAAQAAEAARSATRAEVEAARTYVAFRQQQRDGAFDPIIALEIEAVLRVARELQDVGDSSSRRISTSHNSSSRISGGCGSIIENGTVSRCTRSGDAEGVAFTLVRRIRRWSEAWVATAADLVNRNLAPTGQPFFQARRWRRLSLLGAGSRSDGALCPPALPLCQTAAVRLRDARERPRLAPDTKAVRGCAISSVGGVAFLKKLMTFRWQVVFSLFTNLNNIVFLSLLRSLLFLFLSRPFALG